MGVSGHPRHRSHTSARHSTSAMDAIRKKMQSMKAETDDLYKKISEHEEKTKDSNKESDQFEMMIRDMGKKVQKFDTSMEEIMEKLQLSAAKMDEAEKDFKDKDEDVNAQNRRVLLLEEESRISVEKLATTVMKLAHMSKDADNIVKSCRHWESKTMNNEVEIEEIDINLREARRMASENEKTRRLWKCLRRRPAGARRNIRTRSNRSRSV